ncbi:MAG: tetratricopeptide repeat protein [Niastella sp.]|nr:tetratricopeptide repeat protein [Niastella sp.]
MKRTLIPLITVMLLPVYCLSQQPIVDSLQQLLQFHPAADTFKLHLLNELAFACQQTDPVRGLSYADEAITLAKKLDRRQDLATASSNKGSNYLAQGEDSLALAMYDQALQIHQADNNQRGIARTSFNMGIVHFNRSQYYQAQEYYGQALGIFHKLQDHQREALVKNSIGITWMCLSDYPKALENLLAALRLQESAGNKAAIANTQTNIGIVYKNLKNYSKALSLHQQALATYRETGNMQGMATSLGNIGTTYDEMSDHRHALEAYQQSLALYQKLGNKHGIASSLTNLGIVYNSLANHAAAWQQLSEARKLYQQLDDKNGTLVALHEMGKTISLAPAQVLAQYNIDPSGRYRYSKTLFNNSLQLAQAIGAADKQMTAWQSLYELHEQHHRYDSALYAYEQYIALRDSIFNKEKDQAILKQEMRFEFEKKEAILKAEQDKKDMLAQAAIQRQKMIHNITIAGILLLLAAAVYMFFLYKKKRDAIEKKKEADQRALVAETEMKLLRLQMNPHFLFNSLNSISHYLHNHDVAMADEYLSKFARVVRLVLEHSEYKMVTLAQDTEVLDLYLQLESLRLNHNFTYKIYIAPGIDPEETMIPPFLLLPLVENSIWHGIASLKKGGHIAVRIEQQQQMLLCTVEDNGIGFEAGGGTATNQQRSFGMKITSTRVDLINKTNNTAIGLRLVPVNRGARVDITLPLEMKL